MNKESTHQVIKQAYEVYSLVGGGYNKRHLHGYAWTKQQAQAIADRIHPQRYHIGFVHLIEVDGRWHRIHVIPVETIEGNVADAEDSRIKMADAPERLVPAINFQIDQGSPQRLGLSLEKAIDTLAAYSPDAHCRLYTLRTGGRLPLNFRIRDLMLSEHTQRQVFEWLQHEIEFRTQHLRKAP